VRLSEFRIGRVFWTGGGKWRCTDVGTRTVAAIRIDYVDVEEVDGRTGAVTQRRVTNDPSWFRGPPYAVAEALFDEDGIAGCSRRPPRRPAPPPDQGPIDDIRLSAVLSGAAVGRTFGAMHALGLGRRHQQIISWWPRTSVALQRATDAQRPVRVLRLLQRKGLA
jgi:hypothetical protein